MKDREPNCAEGFLWSGPLAWLDIGPDPWNPNQIGFSNDISGCWRYGRMTAGGLYKPSLGKLGSSWAIFGHRRSFQSFTDTLDAFLSRETSLIAEIEHRRNKKRSVHSTPASCLAPGKNQINDSGSPVWVWVPPRIFCFPTFTTSLDREKFLRNYVTVFSRIEYSPA